MRGAARPLWGNPDFLKFWVALNVSSIGTQLGLLAYPLTAVLVLHAGPVQMGLLRATGSAAAFLAGPFAGVMADRFRRRPLLIASDVGSAIVALSIPLAFTAGALTIAHLYVAQFLSGTLAILAEVTLMSYLPALVRREQLAQANSQLQATGAALSMAGPSAAGVLVQAVGAPLVIALDGVSFVLSAICTLTIRTPEPVHDESARAGIRAEIAEGLRFVYRDRLLRPLAQGIAVHFVFANVIYSLVVLYAVRELGLRPAALGIVFAALGPGFLIGALLAPRLARRFGAGPVMSWAPLLTALGLTLVPLAPRAAPGSTIVLAAAHFLAACGIQLHGVNMVTLRQTITPSRLLGRVNASFRYVNVLGAAVGALAAGLLAERIGIRPTLAIGAIGMLLPVGRLVLSPVRSLHDFPPPPSATGDR